MVNVAQDNRWPFAGDVVTLTATGATGNRARFKLVSKPPESGLQLWDDAEQNWLSGTEKTATIQPDADGTYEITCVDYTVSPNVPHYKSHGATGASIGVEAVATNATTSYSLHIGRKVTRALGTGTHACIVTLHAHHYAGNSPSAGVLTYYAGPSFAAKLSDGSTDIAKQAMRATSVAQAMATIGASGYAGTNALVAWEDVINSSAIDSLGWTILRFNTHVQAGDLRVHNVADSGSTSAVSTAGIATLPDLVTRLNDFGSAYTVHRSRSVSVHSVADSVNLATGSALASGANTAACILRYQHLRSTYNAHIRALFNSVDPASYTQFVHVDGAGHLDEDTPSVVVTLLGCQIATRTLCQKYTAHRARGATALVASAYHNAGTGATDSHYAPGRPKDMATYAAAINEALSVLHDHVTNVNPLTGATEAYHTSADWDSRADWIPRATEGDLGSCLQAHEMLDHMLNRHIAASGAVHARGLSTGAWTMALTGIAKVHADFHDAIVAASAATPANENIATSKLVKLGGFVKV